MDVTFLLYDGVTALDVVGPHEVLGRVPGVRTHLVSPRGGLVTTDLGMQLGETTSIDDAPIPAAVVVPGGPTTMTTDWGDRTFSWLLEAAAAGSWLCSVCTGSLALGAAGLLTGRRATTHWAAMGVLPSMGAAPSDDRVCVDGRLVTAAGVSAGIDMALALAALLTDDDTARMVQLCLEYDPQPPFDSGALHKATPATVDAALHALAATMS